MSIALQTLKDELVAVKAVLEPRIEGLRDFARLNLQPDTAGLVEQARIDDDRRLAMINTTIQALDDLTTDGYPTMMPRLILQAAFNDLQDNVDTIHAAFVTFIPQVEADVVEITAGTPELQS